MNSENINILKLLQLLNVRKVSNPISTTSAKILMNVIKINVVILLLVQTAKDLSNANVLMVLLLMMLELIAMTSMNVMLWLIRQLAITLAIIPKVSIG